MQLFYTELYHLLYTQYISSLCSQRLVVDNMECYSTTLHKTLVQFCTWKRVQNTSLKNLNGNIFSSFLKSTSLTHTPHTVHKLTFKSPTEDMVAGMTENSLSPPSASLITRLRFLQEPLFTRMLSMNYWPRELLQFKEDKQQLPGITSGRNVLLLTPQEPTFLRISSSFTRLQLVKILHSELWMLVAAWNP